MGQLLARAQYISITTTLLPHDDKLLRELLVLTQANC